MAKEHMLVGKEVTVICKDRSETESTGECTDVDQYGVGIKYESRGSKHIEFYPWSNVGSISIKESSGTAKSSGKDSDEGADDDED